MNEEIKALWIDALKSGDYQQGKARLHAEGKFCCLGVLCDLAVKAGVIDEPVLADPWTQLYEHTYKYGKAGKDSLLPMEVAAWAGITETGWLPKWIEEGDSSYNTLYSLNDDGVPFNRIAEFIEEHF